MGCNVWTPCVCVLPCKHSAAAAREGIRVLLSENVANSAAWDDFQTSTTLPHTKRDFWNTHTHRQTGTSEIHSRQHQCQHSRNVFSVMTLSGSLSNIFCICISDIRTSETREANFNPIMNHYTSSKEK